LDNPAGRQLAWSFSEGSTPIRFLIHDRDSKFSRAFDDVFESGSVEIIRIPLRARAERECVRRALGRHKPNAPECADALEHPSDMGVYRKGGTIERAHHHAGSTLRADLRQAAERKVVISASVHARVASSVHRPNLSTSTVLMHPSNEILRFCVGLRHMPLVPSEPFTRRPAAAAVLAGFAAALDLAEVPPEAVEAAKLHLLDTVGCGLAAHALGVAGAGRATAAEAGGTPEATVFGLVDRLPAPAGALANGMLCHGLDFDDTHPRSICHVGTVVAPAAFAVGESVGASGSDVLAAFVAGCEVTARVGAPAAHAYMKQGFHPTGVCGAFGAAAAAARAAGLGADTTASALGLAGSFASGIFEYLSDGSATKPVHAGWAAQAGVLAARLAAHGGEGPATVLEGRFGLYSTYFRVTDPAIEVELGSLGNRWETVEIAFKPYPACHFVHSALDAASEALGGRPLDAENVVEVVVRVPQAAVPLVLEPRAAKIAPRTAYDAKFSLQYSLAAMIVHGRVNVETYSPAAIVDPTTKAVAERVCYEIEDFGADADAFPGGVSVRTRDGASFEAVVTHARGSRLNPMGETGVREKFRANARLALGERDVFTLEEALLHLDSAADVRDALAVVAAAEPVAVPA
jgi:2-methylcitrate dehydratase PrpD